MTEKYLIDESLIVYLSRRDYQFHAQLVCFLEDGGKKHELIMPYSVKYKLGIFTIFRIMTKIKSIFGTNPDILTPLQKASARAILTKNYVKKFIEFPIFKRIFSKDLIKTYLYANENKTQELQRKQSRKLYPTEILSLELCQNALIAQKHNLTIISFNTDYKHLTYFPGSQKAFIKYIHPDSLLKEYNKH